MTPTRRRLVDTIVRPCLATLLLAGAVPGVTNAQQSARVPLAEGLTVTTAINDDKGDYESIKRVTATRPDRIELSYSADTPTGPSRTVRTVLRVDLQESPWYARLFGESDPALIEGTTAIGTSAAVLRDLKAMRDVTFGVEVNDDGGARAAVGILRLVTAAPSLLPIIVNDERVMLPAIHARGRFKGLKSASEDGDAEFFFLDDPDNAVCLRFVIEARKTATLQVIKMTYPAPPRIERALETTGRAEVYGIYFDFSSARIKAESEPALKEIAGLMESNKTWRLRLEGHTDNIGGDAYNRDLSARRAAAVRDELVSKYKISAGRLTTAGFGASRPKEPNTTLEGRARNRRVELVRQ